MSLSGQEAVVSPTLTWSWEAMHRSNSVTNGWASTLLRGGLLDAALLDAVRNDMERGGFGSLGLQAGMRVKWEGLENRMGLHPRVSLASRAVASFSLAPDAFGLVFQGNAPDLGDEMDLLPSGGQSIQWNALHLGLGDAAGLRYVDVGLYHAAWGMHWDVRAGQVFVDESIEVLDASVASDLNVWGENGWGLGLSGRQHWGGQTWFATELLDFGVIRYGQGLQLSIDTTLVTAGLPRFGAGWTVEGVQQDGFGLEIARWRETREGWQVLPAQIAFQGGHRVKEHWTLEGEVRFGGWMPRPRVTLGATYSLPEGWEVTGALVHGGWGRVRPALEFCHVDQRGGWRLRWDDPWGSVSEAGLGRGVHVVWSRNLAETAAESR